MWSALGCRKRVNGASKGASTRGPPAACCSRLARHDTSNTRVLLFCASLVALRTLAILHQPKSRPIDRSMPWCRSSWKSPRSWCAWSSAATCWRWAPSATSRCWTRAGKTRCAGRASPERGVKGLDAVQRRRQGTAAIRPLPCPSPPPTPPTPPPTPHTCLVQARRGAVRDCVPRREPGRAQRAADGAAAVLWHRQGQAVLLRRARACLPAHRWGCLRRARLRAPPLGPAAVGMAWGHRVAAGRLRNGSTC